MSFPQFGQIIDEETVAEKTSDFAPFGEIIEEKKPEKRLRPIGRIAKGVTSGLLGTYGDILDLVGGQTKERLLPGQKALIEAEFKAPESLLPFLQEDDIIPAFSRLPATQEISKLIETLGGPGEPTTTAEKLLEKGPEFIGSLLSVGGVAPGRGIAQKTAQTIFRGLAPGVISVGAERLDLPPWAQAASTIAASLVAHRATGRGLKEINRDTYQKAFSLLPEKATVESKNLQQTARSLRKSLLKGGQAPSEKAVLQFINKILPKIRNGKIKVNELTALKRSLNEIMSLDEVRKAPLRARSLLKNLSKEMNKGIESYGKQNPEFLKLYREANSAFKGMHEASFIERWVKKHPLLTAEGGLVLKYLLPAVTGKGVISAATAAKGVQIANALARNPGLRKAYFRFLKEASNEQVKPTLEALKKFNAHLKKEIPDLE